MTATAQATNPCTALILLPRPQETYMEEVPDLETNGHLYNAEPRVRRYKGAHCEEVWHRADFPERSQRSPEEEDSWTIDQDNTRRILALIDTLQTTDPRARRAITEIRYRVEILNPLVIH